MAVGFSSGALDVAGMADSDQHVGVGDQIFELDFVDLVDDLRAAIVAVRLLHFLELAGDDLLQLFVAGEDFFQLGDVLADGLQFLENFVDRELRQAVELQFEDGVDLDGREAEGGAAASRFAFDGANLVLPAVELDTFEFPGLAIFGDGDVLLGEILEQVFLGVCAAGRTANDANNVVEMVERNLVADQNVFALAGLAQLVDGAPAHDFDAMLDEQLDERDEAELARLTPNDGQQDHAEGFLHLGVLEKIVEDELGFFAALDFHDDAHALARGFVAHVGDAVDFFVLHQVGDALDELGFVDLIGNFGDDDIFAVFADVLDGGFGAHHEAAAARFVGGFDAFAAGDVCAGRKIRARDQLHDFLESGVRFFDQQHRGFDDFPQIVWRNVGGHAHGNAAGAVDEEIGDARRKNEGLFARLIEVRNEIDRLFFEVGQNVFADFRQAGFRVPHGRRRIAVHGAEVSLAVDERVAHVEVLREADERGIDDGFTVRVIVAGGVAADFRALAEAAIGGQAEVVHGHQDAALHGLETVSHVGESARDDDAHRVVEIRLAHFRFDIYGKQDGFICLVGHFLSLSPSAWSSDWVRSFAALRMTALSSCALQHKSLHGIEGVGCVGETLRREMLFKLAHKVVALIFRGEFNRHATFVVRRYRGRGAKLGAAQPAQPGQCAPAELVHHGCCTARGRRR